MSDLRVAVLGVGVMGADHVARITGRISNARVVVMNDYLSEKAEQVAASVPGARVVGDPLDAIADRDVDAVVLATPGPVHEKQLLACLEHGKPVLCEKPLTTEVETSLEVVKREAELGKRLIQVGFMRRFDQEYAQLKALIDGGELGQPLVIHCVHRNPAVPPSFDSAMMVQGFAGTRGRRHAVPVRRGDRFGANHQARIRIPRRRQGLQDPQIAIIQTETGKPRRRRAVRHHRRRLRGTHRGGGRERQRHNRSRRRAGRARSSTGKWGGRITPGFRERFGTGLRHRVAAVGRRGAIGRSTSNKTGPTAWDGTPQRRSAKPASNRWQSGERVAVEMAERVIEVREHEDRTGPDPVPPRLRAARIPASGGGFGLRVPAADATSGLHPVLQPPARRRRTGRPSSASRARTPVSVSRRCCRCCGGRVPTRTPAKPRCATGSASSRSPSTSAST